MPKLTPARLDGLYGMKSFTAEELFKRADELAQAAADPAAADDPRWLRRWSNRIRRLAQQKEAAAEHKQRRAKPRHGSAN